MFRTDGDMSAYELAALIGVPVIGALLLIRIISLAGGYE